METTFIRPRLSQPLMEYYEYKLDKEYTKHNPALNKDLNAYLMILGDREYFLGDYRWLRDTFNVPYELINQAAASGRPTWATDLVEDSAPYQDKPYESYIILEKGPLGSHKSHSAEMSWSRLYDYLEPFHPPLNPLLPQRHLTDLEVISSQFDLMHDYIKELDAEQKFTADEAENP